MPLFGAKLSDIEYRLLENVRKNKAVFPDEIQQIETGSTLIRDLTEITKETSKGYPEKPNYSTNHELFARNRQLLLNAYVSLLFSSYGTQFVILRTVLENNNLMRLFNKNPQYAFEWLPVNLQKRFTAEMQSKYGKSGKHDRTYYPSFVRKLVFDTVEKEKVRDDIKKFYDQLCDYTHPNYAGWKELVVQKQDGERILNVPCFSLVESDTAIGVYLFSMQTTFKAFVETFRGYLAGFAIQLKTWQERNTELLLRHMENRKT
jgi:hypothetical protein